MINEILNDADAKMNKSVEATREEFATIRAGRANPSMFSKIVADYYGTPTPLQSLASALRKFADDLGPAGRDPSFGFGRVNLLQAATE